MAGAGYTALAIVLTWPVAGYLSSGFPHDAFDPALNAWILWWNAHAVPLTERWWNAPSFWPVAGALSFSEHLLGLTFVSTPLLWMGADPVTTYNLVLLISYPLTALAAHGLVFAIVRRHGPAVLAGLIMGFSPYRVAQLPHVQMLWAFGMPLVLVAAHLYLETGARFWLVALGAAWLMLALSNSYFLLFFPVLFAAWILWFASPTPRRAAAIVATWLGFSLPLIPILWSYASIHRAQNLTRRFDEIESFGADLTAIFTTAPEMIVWRPLSIAGRGEGQLFPGAIALGLVAGGVVLAVLEWRRRRQSTQQPKNPSVNIIRWTLAGLAIVGTAIAAQPAADWPVAPRGGRTVDCLRLVRREADDGRSGSRGGGLSGKRSVRRPLAPAIGARVLRAGHGGHAGLELGAASEARRYADPVSRSVRVAVAAAGTVRSSRARALRHAGGAVPGGGGGPRVCTLHGLAQPARSKLSLTAVCAAAVIAESWPAITLVAAATPIAALQRAISPVR